MYVLAFKINLLVIFFGKANTDKSQNINTHNINSWGNKLITATMNKACDYYWSKPPKNTKA